MIWYNGNKPPIEALNSVSANTLVAHLDIKIESVDDDSLTGSMPVDARTHQPYGILHGGASVVLAETLGSLGSSMCVDIARFNVVGLDINSNHIRAVRDGRVTAIAKPIHLGRRTHVWSIEQHDDRQRLTTVSRLTMAILERSE
ncbi:MAG: hotdog fold thioesterase [Pseudomonadota bacterium]